MVSTANGQWREALRPIGELLYFLWRLSLVAIRVTGAAFALYGFVVFMAVQHPETLTVDQLADATPSILSGGLFVVLILAVSLMALGKAPFGRILPRRWWDALYRAQDWMEEKVKPWLPNYFGWKARR